MKKVCIIGGGVAGLTAGIYAQMRGFACEIYEKNAAVGGNLTGWDKQGYHIDNCIHWLNGTAQGTKLRKIWEETGALQDTDIFRREAFYTSAWEGQTLSLWRDTARTRRDMLLLSPGDRREINRLMDTVEAVAFHHNGAAAFVRYGGMSLGELANRFLHPLLQYICTDLLTEAFSAAGLVYAYAAFAAGNADLPRGGSAAMAKRMAARFEETGGSIFTDAAVVRVETCADRATGIVLEDGTFIHADWVICCCDPTITFGKLLPAGYMPRSLRRAYREVQTHPVFSSVQAAFAVDSDSGLLTGTGIIPAEDLTVLSRRHTRLAIREFSHEPSFAPPGKTVIQALLFQDRQECAHWQRLYRQPERYQAEKEKVAEAIQAEIIRYYPQTAEHIERLDCWTPATYARYFDSYCGAYMAFAVTGHRRRPATVPSEVPGLCNVLLATQWQKAPGGLPNAARSACRAVDILISEQEESG